MVGGVVNEEGLKGRWVGEVEEMGSGIVGMGEEVVKVLRREMGEGNLDYVVNEGGMLSYRGLSGGEVERVGEEFGVYVMGRGGMCVGGLNRGNVEGVGKGFGGVM